MLMLLFAGCALSDSDQQGGAVHELPPPEDGKWDNYVSSNAREFELSGTAHVQLPGDFAEQDEVTQDEILNRAVTQRLSVVARSVERYIKDVVSETNLNDPGEDNRWFVYFKPNNAESNNARVLNDGRAAFDFEMELVGSYFLMSKVAPEGGTYRSFDVEVKDWSETTGETVTVRIQGSKSRDAFPRYDEMFADGVFDIAVHFGGDYNSGRHDLETAEWLVEHLIEQGWDNTEVESYEDLVIDSPPFTRHIILEGNELEMQVYVYHSDMVDAPNQEELSRVMRSSLAQRDVVVYSGHSGPGAGFVLDYHPRYEIRAREFESLELADKYQIYIFDGCQTYRTYVDDIMKNPLKSFDENINNLDIVTTVNNTPFGVGYQVLFEVLYWFTITDMEGNHYPLSWLDFLRGVNTENFRTVHYGVHGVDHNPKLNPHASQNIACRPCTKDSDCGAGGNFCLNYSGGPACGVACTTDTACPPGYRCARLYDDPDLFYIPKQCVRRDYICE